MNKSATVSETHLPRVIGVRALTASVFNITVAATIFVLPAEAARDLGTSAPVAYLICAFMMGLILMCFVTAGRHVSQTGGPYAFVELALGPFVGFIAGMLLWCGNLLGVASMANLMVTIIGAGIPALGAAWMRPVLLLAVFAAVAWPNYRGSTPGVRLIEWMTLIKLLPLALVILAGLALRDLHNLNFTGSNAASNLGSGLILVFYAFTGAELALIPSGEIRDSKRTLPIALGLGLALATLVYLGTHLASLGALGDRLPASKAPVAEAAQVLLGPWAAVLILVGSVFSIFGGISGDMLCTPRILFAFARDGFISRGLAAIHPRFSTPHRAILVHAIMLSLLSTAGGFRWLAEQSSVMTLLLYLLCCLAAWRVSWRPRSGQRLSGGSKLARALIPWLASALIVWVLSKATWMQYLVAGGFVALASLIFAVRRTRLTIPDASES